MEFHSKENICSTCNKIFSRKYDLARHIKNHTGEKPFICEICGKMYARKDEFRGHLKTHNPENICPTCNKYFTRKESLEKHQKMHLKEKSFDCNICDRKFSEKRSLRRHMQIHTNEKLFTCKKCDKSFTSNRKLQQHIKIHIDIYKCEKCDKTFGRQQNLSQHMKVKHAPKLTEKQKTAFQPGISKFVEGRRTALNIFSTYQFTPLDENKQDLIKFFNQLRNDLNEYLIEELEEKNTLKWYFNIKVRLVRISNDYGEDFITPHFRSKSNILTKNSSIKDEVEEALQKINQSFEDFIQMGSGWTLDNIYYLEVSCAQYSPFG